MKSPLRQLRQRRQLTIAQVCAATGLDPGNLSRIERGVQIPSKENTEKLVRFFEHEVTELQIFYPERFADLPFEPISEPGGQR